MSEKRKITSSMKTITKTQICLAVTLAAAAMTANAATTDYQDTTTLTEPTTITTGVQAAGTSGAVIQGSTGNESLTFDYQGADSVNAIVHAAQGHDSFTLSNFAEIHFENHTTATEDGAKASIVAVGNYWGNGAISINNVDRLSFGTESEAYYGSAVQAIGAGISIDVTDLYINATGNGLYLQQTNNNRAATNGHLTVKVADSLVVHTSTSPAVFVQSWGDGATENPTLALEARTIDISAEEMHAVAMQDHSAAEGAASSATLSMTAQDGISIRSTQYDAVNIVSQLATGTADGTKRIDITSQNGSIEITGSRYGVNATTTTSELDTAKAVDISGASVVINGQEGSIHANANADVGIDAEQTTLTGDVAVSDSSSLSFAGRNSNETYVTLEGSMTADASSAVALQNATLDLADGSMNVNTLTGSDSSIVLNNLSNQTITIGQNEVASLSVVASGTANDAYGSAEAAADALANAATVTNSSSGTYALSGEAGAVSEGWTATVDDQGNTTITSVEENASMAAIADFSAMTLAQWRGEINHLSQRLGDLRGHSSDIGAWARVYGYDASLSDTVEVDMKSNSIQVGADARVGGNWVVGGAFSYTDQDADFSNGSGTSEGYALAAYAAGYFDCGGYIDVIGRIGRMSSDVEALSQGGSLFDGSYDNTAFGLSVETGWRWNATDTFYVEPQAELSYGFIKGDDFTSGVNGAKIEQDDFQSLVGRLGVRTGADFSDRKGAVYLQASVNHDFLGDADATATPAAGQSRTISTDLGGTWFSYGVGLQYAADNGVNFYASLERASGSEYEEHYRYNVGARYNF